MRRTYSLNVSIIVALLLMLAPAALVAQSGTPIATPVSGDVGEVRVIGVHVLEDGLMIDDTPVGGISGIDYDPQNDTWYMISDDRSDLAPARFFTGDIAYTGDGFGSMSIDSAVTLLQRDGTPYPNAEEGGNVPDTESLRVDPREDLVWYSSEGDQSLGIDPFIAATRPDGTWVSEVRLPDIFRVDRSGEIGTRNNKGIEAMTLSGDGETIWFAMEAALFQDGDESTVEQGSVTRLTQIDREGNVLASYPYVLDPLMHVPDGGEGSNGLAEILWVDDTTFLSLERLSVQDSSGEYTNYIRIYEVEIGEATDVSTMTSLEGQDWTPVSKRLLIDLNEAGVEPVDNIEALSWGPVLENGNRSLVVASDNNFNPGDQVTVFVALEVVD